MTDIRLDMVELIGRGYVIDHCVSSFLKSTEQQMFLTYVATCAQNINTILANRYGGSYYQRSYAELAGLDRRKKEDKRTAEEIALDVIKRAGLNLGGE